MEALGSRLRDPKTAIPHLLVEALMAEGLSWHRPAQGMAPPPGEACSVPLSRRGRLGGPPSLPSPRRVVLRAVSCHKELLEWPNKGLRLSGGLSVKR